MRPCHRCGGLRVQEHERDMDQGVMLAYARCVLCGAYTDLYPETVQVVRDAPLVRHRAAHWRNDGKRAIP